VAAGAADLPECVAGHPAPGKAQSTEPVNPADHGGPDGVVDPNVPLVTHGCYDDQLSSVDEFVSKPDAVVVACVAEDRRGEPRDVDGLIETARLLTVEVHSVVAGDVSEGEALTVAVPGWGEIYGVEREVLEAEAIRAELGDRMVLALKAEDGVYHPFTNQAMIRLDGDKAVPPDAARYLAHELGPVDAETLLTLLREAASR
jgi:hypothetical protein